MKDAERYSALGLMILALLTEAPMHAYRMQQMIKSRGKDKVVNVRQRTSLHQTLARLERLGFVETRAVAKSENRPDRTIYAITAGGRSAAKVWLCEMLTTIGDEFPAFPAAVSVLVMLTPDEARTQLVRRGEALRGAIVQLAAEAGEVGALPRLFLLEDAYRTQMIKAELAWLETVINDLESGELTWNDQWIAEVAHRSELHDRLRSDRDEASD